MARAAITVHGAKEAALDINQLGSRAINYPAMAERLSPVFSSIGSERFSSEGFGSWPPLAESTKRRWGSHQILRLTGTLRSTLVGADATDTAPSGIRYGTDLRYAVFHQEGRGVPLRDMIDLSMPQRERLAKTIETYLMGAED